MFIRSVQKLFLAMCSRLVGSVVFALMVTGLVQAGDVHKGESLYKLHCLSCHGDRGRPVMPGAPDLSRGEGLMQSDQSLLNVLRTGNYAHPGYQGVLRDQEIFDVVSFIRTFY